MLQQTIVFAIVAAALVYAVWHWMPRAWRQALAPRLASGSRRIGVAPERAERLAQTLAAPSGCGACESCGTCAGKTAAGQKTDAPQKQKQ
ncbi:hypothetical protein PY257_14290 [Ramlibacter sp. H39-3-26]|uniref:DUF6587 family protein n=1 Tax=Curvibacter soli TaxID=3031331 RepID=UPI0023DB8B77|nr:DUF6587 family protein [Ramlibacter sp. H39-3-26]MDF1486331.1 hypothetical protein [Ramlibacter sp. H39-3-26]